MNGNWIIATGFAYIGTFFVGYLILSALSRHIYNEKQCKEGISFAPEVPVYAREGVGESLVEAAQMARTASVTAPKTDDFPAVAFARPTLG